jgi:hypothetical protein
LSPSRDLTVGSVNIGAAEKIFSVLSKKKAATVRAAFSAMLGQLNKLTFLSYRIKASTVDGN